MENRRFSDDPDPACSINNGTGVVTSIVFYPSA
jgi:hypothetical protein